MSILKILGVVTHFRGSDKYYVKKKDLEKNWINKMVIVIGNYYYAKTTSNSNSNTITVILAITDLW